MNKKKLTEGEYGDTSVKELKWMAEFLARHGQPKKALEIYRALVDSMSNKDDNVKTIIDESKEKAA